MRSRHAARGWDRSPRPAAPEPARRRAGRVATAPPRSRSVAPVPVARVLVRGDRALEPADRLVLTPGRALPAVGVAADGPAAHRGGPPPPAVGVAAEAPAPPRGAPPPRAPPPRLQRFLDAVEVHEVGVLQVE